jgi:NADPH:quinone reductase-like Zn-dependent oxidoreductase
MSQPKSAAEIVAEANGRLEDSTVKYKRVVISRLGGPEVLEVREEDLAEPGLGEVRVRILATGVSYADLLMREGVHPEAPRPPFTPGWDLVGIVDKLGVGAYDLEPGQMVAALPVWGANAEFICLPQEELVPVPKGLDPAEALVVVFNYVTAYQMMRRSVRVKPGQRVLIHGAAGGVGTALLQLGRLAGLEMYGTASEPKHELVSNLGATPIDYRHADFVEEILRLTGDGVDVVFDGIGSTTRHLWRSFKTLRAGGKVVAYGMPSTLRGGRLAGGRRHPLRGLVRLRGLATIGIFTGATYLIPGKKRTTPYSIQTLKRFRPAWYREDLSALLELLRQGKIEPIIAERIPLEEAARAHELLGRGAVTGKIVLLCNTNSPRQS